MKLCRNTVSEIEEGSPEDGLFSDGKPCNDLTVWVSLRTFVGPDYYDRYGRNTSR